MPIPKFRVGGEITKKGIRFYVKKNGKKLPKRFKTRKSAVAYALRQLVVFYKREKLKKRKTKRKVIRKKKK